MGNSENLEQRLQSASTSTTNSTSAKQSNEREKNENKDAKSRKSKIKKNKVSDKAAKSSSSNDKNNACNKKKKKTKSGDKENEKLSQQTTHVQFSFDDYTPPDDVTQLPVDKPTVNNVETDEPDNVPTTEVSHGTELKIREDGDPVIDLTDERRRFCDLADAEDRNGNYDELPVIRIDDNSNYDIAGSGPENEITALSRSSESIPFIDEGETVTTLRRSPRQQRNQLAVVHHHQYQNQPPSSTSSSQLSLTPYYHQHLQNQQQQQVQRMPVNQYHYPHYNHLNPSAASQQHQLESRIITLIPKNFESHNLITPTVSTANSVVGISTSALPTTSTTIVPMQTFLPVKLPHQLQISGGNNIGTSCSLTRPIHIMPRIDEQRDELHKFQYYYNPGFKMCQICHLYLHVCPAIKCYECEFVCHRQCLHKVSETF